MTAEQPAREPETIVDPEAPEVWRQAVTVSVSHYLLEAIPSTQWGVYEKHFTPAFVADVVDRVAAHLEVLSLATAEAAQGNPPDMYGFCTSLSLQDPGAVQTLLSLAVAETLQPLLDGEPDGS